MDYTVMSWEQRQKLVREFEHRIAAARADRRMVVSDQELMLRGTMDAALMGGQVGPVPGEGR